MRQFAFFTLLFAFAVAIATREPAADEDAAATAPPTDGDGAGAAVLAAARAPDAPAVGNGFAGVTLDRAANSHFYLDAQVNGRPLRFLVDTGATSVALSRADARRLGLALAPQDFTGSAQTAAGAAAVAPVRLDSLRAGPLAATDVEAVVIDIEDGMPLLGQSFLRRLSDVRVQGDRMTLR